MHDGAVEQAFHIFLQRITPPRSQVSAARVGHTTLRERLERDGYFGDLISDTFLNGSYARRTTIRPIRDVDVVIVVGNDWLDVSPVKAMESLRRKLSQWYDGGRTRKRRRAVQIQLSSVDLDALLAVAPDGDGEPLRIPDRNQESWILTHPRKQLALCERLSECTGGNYSRLVRLLKAWVAGRISSRVAPRSFVLECSAYYIMAQAPTKFSGAVPAAFVELLNGLSRWDFGRSGWFSWGSPTVPDPALPDVNVADRWASGSADCVRRGFELALRRCAAIEKARWDETAIAGWGELFGGTFPAPSGVLA